MHSHSQDTRCEGGDAEVFSSLRLAGFDGRCKAVLDASRLVLERRSGHTLNLKHETVARMRHHTTPLIPRWMFGIGLFFIYAAWRVFLPPAQFWFLGVGSAIILGWALGRRPTLTIDTTNGDCHTLYGNDLSLMRMTALVQRLQDGQTLDEARDSLNLLMREADFPATKAVVERLEAESEPEPLIPNPSIPAFLSTDIEEKEDKAELPPEWIGTVAGSAIISNEPEFSEHPVQSEAINRARAAHDDYTYSRPATTGIEDPWAMNDVNPLPNEGHSMFGEGGLFGSTQIEQKPQVQPQMQTQIPQQMQAPMMPPWQSLPQQTQSSMDMLKQAAEVHGGGDSLLRDGMQAGHSPTPTSFIPSFLPPVNQNDPEKDRIKVEAEVIEAEILDDETSPLVANAVKHNQENNTEVMGRFPHMQKLMNQRNDGGYKRIKMHGRKSNQGGKAERGKLIPGLGKLAKRGKELLTGRGGNSRTTEALRLEAQRNKDAQILKEIQKMADSEDGLNSEEVERLLENHRNGTLPENDVPLRFSELSATSDSKKEVSLPRLDSDN